MKDFWIKLATPSDNRPHEVQPRLSARFESTVTAEPIAGNPTETVEPASSLAAMPSDSGSEPSQPSHIPNVVETPPLSTIEGQVPAPRADPPVAEFIPLTARPNESQADPARDQSIQRAENVSTDTSPPPSPIVQQPILERIIERQPMIQPVPGPHSTFLATERQRPPLVTPLMVSPSQTDVEASLETSAPSGPSSQLVSRDTGVTIRPDSVHNAPIRLEDGDPSARPTINRARSDTNAEPIRPQNGHRLEHPVTNQVRPNAPAEPIVNVSIGRIELRPALNPQPSRSTAQPRPRFQPQLTLNAYLKRRNGGVS